MDFGCGTLGLEQAKLFTQYIGASPTDFRDLKELRVYSGDPEEDFHRTTETEVGRSMAIASMAMAFRKVQVRI